MLRALIIMGLLLMTVGFGAAGWQYWQSQAGGAVSDDSTAGAPDLPQDWLISVGGGLVAPGDTLAYLAQDRLVPGRAAVVTLTAPLGDLLAEGEKLPDAPYLQVLADIRAPRIAQTLCPVMLEGPALQCEVNAARVVEGSVNTVQGTATFQIELVYRQKPEADGLPDLAAHVLGQRTVALDLGQDPTASGSATAALAAALRATEAGCAAEAVIACRILGMTLDWAPGRPPRAEARIAWLSPLPEGIYIAPPLLDTPPEDAAPAEG